MGACFFRSALYAILDKETFHRQGLDIAEGARALLQGGCRVLQYRDKISPAPEIARTAFSLLRAASSHNAMLVLNDGIGSFLRLHGPAVKSYSRNLAFHFGQQDNLPVTANCITFGRSTHNAEEIRRALRENPRPQYIAFGSVFRSPTKPRIQPVLHEINLAANLWRGPIVFIGGINLSNLNELQRQLPHQNRYAYAVITDLFRFGNRPQDLEHYAAEFEREVRLWNKRWL